MATSIHPTTNNNNNPLCRTHYNDASRGDADQQHGDNMRVIAAAIADTVRREYARFLNEEPILADTAAQAAILAEVVQRLAVEGVPLSGVLQTVYRAYGLNLESAEIVDSRTGATLLSIER